MIVSESPFREGALLLGWVVLVAALLTGAGVAEDSPPLSRFSTWACNFLSAQRLLAWLPEVSWAAGLGTGPNWAAQAGRSAPPRRHGVPIYGVGRGGGGGMHIAKHDYVERWGPGCKGKCTQRNNPPPQPPIIENYVHAL
jgi:hypothetical protein